MKPLLSTAMLVLGLSFGAHAQATIWFDFVNASSYNWTYTLGINTTNVKSGATLHGFFTFPSLPIGWSVWYSVGCIANSISTDRAYFLTQGEDAKILDSFRGVNPIGDLRTLPPLLLYYG